MRIELSTRPEKWIGDDAIWERAEQALADALEASGMAYEVNPGEGAFYGPKIDFHVSDALGRCWQLGTVQLDYQLPERFGLTYVGADGAEHRPVMIHRAMLGSLERFMAILIEHTAGAFPLWLAPVQAVVLPVSEKFAAYGEEVRAALAPGGVRVELDARNEKLGYKIREAQLQKVPYMLVVGGREQEGGRWRCGCAPARTWAPCRWRSSRRGSPSAPRRAARSLRGSVAPGACRARRTCKEVCRASTRRPESTTGSGSARCG